MEEKAKYYLDYLDKEMSIMGVLSTFSVAVPSILIERIVSSSKESIAYSFLHSLIDNGLSYLIISLALMFFTAACFYKQRSLLAWYYGQLSLEISLPKYTLRRVKEWLKDADSWETWIPYNIAFWILFFAFIFFGLALASIFNQFIQIYTFQICSGLLVILIFWLLWLSRNSIKYKFSDDNPYFRIH